MTIDELEIETRERFARVTVAERPGFREDLRARLLAQVGPMARERHRPHGLANWLRPLVIGAAVLAFVVGSGGLVAGASLPGDPLFPLKRAVEEIALALAPGEPVRLDRLLAQAEARRAELSRTAPGSEARISALAEYAAALRRLAETAERLRALDPSASGLPRALIAVRSGLALLEQEREALPAELSDAVRRAIEAGSRLERVPPDQRELPVPTVGPIQRPLPTGGPTERPRPTATRTPGAAPAVTAAPERSAPSPPSAEPSPVRTGPPAATAPPPPAPTARPTPAPATPVPPPSVAPPTLPGLPGGR